MSKKREPDVSENPLYHDTWTLLRKYRDVVWSLELSVQRVRRQFQIEFGSSIEDFLESIYIAGLDFEGTDIAEQAKSIERSHKMLKLVEHSVNLLREKHKNGEGEFFMAMKTREQIYRQEAASLLRDVTTYHCAKGEQLKRLYPGKEEKIEHLLGYLVKQGRVY